VACSSLQSVSDDFRSVEVLRSCHCNVRFRLVNQDDFTTVIALYLINYPIYFLVWCAMNQKYGIIGPYYIEEWVPHKRIPGRFESTTLTAEKYKKLMERFYAELKERVGETEIHKQMYMQVLILIGLFS